MEGEMKLTKIQLVSPVDPTIDFVDKPLSQVISQLTGLLNSIPLQFRDTAKFKMSQFGDYYDGYSEVEHEIYYIRPETIDEAIARVEADNNAMLRKEAAERRQLAALEAKYR